MVDAESGFCLTPNLISKHLSIQMQWKLSFKDKSKRFNSGANPDFSVNFDFSLEIRPKIRFGSKPKLRATFTHGLTSVSIQNSVLNFRYSEK